MDYLYVHELSTEFHPQWSHFESKWYIVRKKSEKRRLFKKVQAFCEEKVLRCL